jgi:HrpA-like RNA helicase
MITGGGGPSLYSKGKLQVPQFPKGSKLAKKEYPKQKELDEQIPLDYIMGWIKARLSQTGLMARCLILRSSTGSGKSTVLPPELYHQLFEQQEGRNIVCTQPKVLTATEMTESVVPYNTAEALKAAGKSSRQPLIMEQNIGFQTGAVVRKPLRGIVYMTIGVLMRQLVVMTDEEVCNQYSFIIIDEAHERSIEIDMTLLMLRRLLLRQVNNKRCPFVIIMSATMDPHAMADYMLASISLSARYANIIEVQGSTFPIEEHFLDVTSMDYVRAALDTVIAIHSKEGEEKDDLRDVLIFAPGELEIKAIREAIEKSGHPCFTSKPIYLITLNRFTVQQRGAEYNATFADPSTLSSNRIMARGGQECPIPVLSSDGDNYGFMAGGNCYDSDEEIPQPRAEEIRGGADSRPKGVYRRIIISTNVAETGVTIPSLGYVIDTGLWKSSEFNPVIGCNLLETKPVTRFMYTQRRGRVGRRAPGTSYALYTKETLEGLPNDRLPDLVRSDITSEILSMIVRECDPGGEIISLPLHEVLKDADIMAQIGKTKIDLTKSDLLTPPPTDLLQYALNNLYVLGCITANSTPTKLGWLLSQFDKIEVENAKMILAAWAWGACPLDLVTVAAMLESGAPILPPDKSSDETSEQTSHQSYQTWYQLTGGDEFLLRLWSWWTTTTSKDNPNTALYTEATKRRDSYIDCLVRMGLNPYENVDKSIHVVREDREDWIVYFQRLKQCIWEGYKLNLAEWTGTQYRASRYPAMFSIDKSNRYAGRYVLYTGLFYSNARFRVSAVSPMDGYVAVDPNFTLP